jgi:hypothetical protein
MNAWGKTQSSVVHIQKVTMEPDIIERATRKNLCIHLQKEGWRMQWCLCAEALLSLFKADSRESHCLASRRRLVSPKQLRISKCSQVTRTNQ